MKYRLIRVYSKICPKRFYRKMYVREDLNLQELGVFILYSLGAEFEHMFLFEGRKVHYVDSSWLEDEPLWDYEMKDYSKYTLDTAQCWRDDTIKLEYDTGDGWEFVIKKLKTIKEFPDEDVAGWCVELAGYPLWEDNIMSFYEYIEDGKIEVNDEYGYPWNVDYPNNDVSYFDRPIDIVEHNRMLKELDIKELIAELFTWDLE